MNFSSSLSASKYVITKFLELKFPGIGKDKSEVAELLIHHSDLGPEHLPLITSMRNLELISLVSSDDSFLDGLLKKIDLFNNLYSIKIYKNSFDANADKDNLASHKCFDNGKILSVTGLKRCTVHKSKPEIAVCYDCYSMDRLENTTSPMCEIDGIVDADLMSSITTNVEKLTLIVDDLTGYELENLPYGIKKVVLIYKSTKYTPKEFYSNHCSKIKIPFGAKFTIIWHFRYAVTKSKETRYLVVS
jgi:hypothetical protein